MTGSHEITSDSGTEASPELRDRVLHVVVGHGLRTYFMNAVRSLRSVAPRDDILVVDNASPDRQLHLELQRLADNDGSLRLLLRDSNSLVNGKVGGLYDAYRDAFAIALDEDYDYVHLVQGDMQVLWWDSDVLTRAAEIFTAEPFCVNIYTCMLPVDRAFDDSLTESSVDKLPKIREYGLTDLGIYDLARWKSLDISFDNDEIEHGQRYLSQGFSVICHPWPTDAQIPWPAVVRNGIQQGREVNLVREYLLRPLSLPEVESLKARNWTRLEDACVPWGWTCLTPMWATDVNIDYWANRRQQLKREGLLHSIPRFQRSGLDNRSLRTFLLSQHRPSLWQLFAVAPARELRKRFKLGVRDAQ